MAYINALDKQRLETIFGLNNGEVLNLPGKEFDAYFKNILNIDINSLEYLSGGVSNASKLKTFWDKADNNLVAQSIIDIANTEINRLLDMCSRGHILPDAQRIFDNRCKLMESAKEIAAKINNLPSTVSTTKTVVKTEALIEISINKDVNNHIKTYLDNNDMFHAVEEAYKFVRQKLRQLTGHERAQDVFNLNSENTKYWETLFGSQPDTNTPEHDFCRGVGYLHLGIQFLRNEKAHTPAQDLEANLAYHYIALASLAYELISRNVTK